MQDSVSVVGQNSPGPNMIDIGSDYSSMHSIKHFTFLGNYKMYHFTFNFIEKVDFIHTKLILCFPTCVIRKFEDGLAVVETFLTDDYYACLLVKIG